MTDERPSKSEYITLYITPSLILFEKTLLFHKKETTFLYFVKYCEKMYAKKTKTFT